MLLRGTLVWLGILVLANLNGVLREFLLSPRLGAATAHVLSTLLLALLVVAVSWLAIRWIAPPSSGIALGLGAWWVALTLAFEFGAGHFLFRKSWADLLADYNVAAGRIWLLVPVVTFLAPLWALRLRGIR